MMSFSTGLHKLLQIFFHTLQFPNHGMALLRIFRKPTPEQSDRDLLELYRSSDRSEYLGQLYERYLELAYGICLKYLKDEQAAEDAVMGVFEELLAKVKQHDIREFDKWLHSVLRNYCLMQLRKKNRQKTESFDPALMQSAEIQHPTGDLDIEQNEQALRDCIEQLPAQQKQCVSLFYMDGQSYKEIAEALSEDLGKVRSNIQNGRRNLRICVEGKLGRI